MGLVFRKGAGFAELDVAVTSPLGQDLPLQVRSGPDKESDIIEFTPTLPGNYQFKITYGGDEVPGKFSGLQEAIRWGKKRNPLSWENYVAQKHA